MERDKDKWIGKIQLFIFLPFNDTELSIVGTVVSDVVLCAFVVVVVAAVEVVDPSVALVLYVKFAKFCVIVCKN